ncbi:MAG: hypothetical protein LBI04_12130 [Treponema sp.]|nr:hypothetical protein [Treponema sp.]
MPVMLYRFQTKIVSPAFSRHVKENITGIGFEFINVKLLIHHNGIIPYGN